MSAGYLSGCAGKARFETRDAAMAARAGMLRKGGPAMGQMRSYRCMQCGGWHNGHAGMARRRRVRGR